MRNVKRKSTLHCKITDPPDVCMQSYCVTCSHSQGLIRIDELMI